MSRPLTVMAAIAALLLSAGCGGSNSPSADDAASTGSESRAATPASSTEAAAAGKVNTRYDDAQTPDAEQGRGLMMDAKLLEAVAAQVNDTLNLPYDITVVGKQCGEPNDYWDPSVNEIQLCYEDIQQSEQRFAGSGNPDSTTAAVDATTSGFYHELGHATLSIYELAFTGREEDVADQLSAFMLLAPGADGTPYPNGVRIATNTAQDWRLSAKEDGDANDLPFWMGIRWTSRGCTTGSAGSTARIRQPMPASSLPAICRKTAPAIARTSSRTCRKRGIRCWART